MVLFAPIRYGFRYIPPAFLIAADFVNQGQQKKVFAFCERLGVLVLQLWNTSETTRKPYYGEPPDRSIVGIVIAAVSLVTMPVLYVLKRRTAHSIGSLSLATDAKQTLACIMLSVALLIGSGLHHTMGLWQADPVAGLIIAAFLVREGHEAWKSQKLCC
jgi:divalent metal cation (Fe/Co/Zn/Cd) transporter